MVCTVSVPAEFTRITRRSASATKKNEVAKAVVEPSPEKLDFWVVDVTVMALPQRKSPPCGEPIRVSTGPVSLMFH